MSRNVSGRRRSLVHRTRYIFPLAVALPLAACVAEQGDTELLDSPSQNLVGRKIGATLPNGGQLRQGDSLYNNGYELVLQTDCNLVLYDWKGADGCDSTNFRALWSSRTNGRSDFCYGLMQPDGNFVIYDRGQRPLWATGTNNRATGGELNLSSVGDARVVANNVTWWSTNIRPNPTGAARECKNPFAQPEAPDRFTKPFAGMGSNRQPPNDVYVICMDAKEPGGFTLPPSSEIWARLGDTQGWFNSVSRGRFFIPIFNQWGCGHGGAPPMVPEAKYTGTYFDDFWARTPGSAAEKGAAVTHEFRRIALETARAQGLNFEAFDRNRDGRIGANELGVITVRPADTDAGSVRITNVNLGSVRSVPTVDLILANTAADPGYRQALFTHELMHLLTGALDMYDSPQFQAGFYSIMDDMSGLNAIDPVHALKTGWLDAKAYPITGQGVLSLRTMNVDGDAAILYVPSVDTKEYFIVARLSNGGVNLWRVVEDKNRMKNSPWAATYKTWLDGSGGEGRWGIHKVNSTPLADGQRVPLEMTSGNTGFFISVNRNPPEGSTEPVGILLSR